MRDLVLTTFLLGSLPFVLSRPWYGALLWVWVSTMSPHRLTWGFAYDFQFALLIAVATLAGLFISRDPKHLPITPITIVLMLFTGWMSFTTLFALYPEPAAEMWEKVMKSMFMLLVVMSVMHSKRHVQLLFIVVTLSVAFYGVKGGIFTILGGGQERVYGPGGSFIEENNSLALAVLMMIPLLRGLQTLWTNRWLKLGLLGSMVLCGFSVLGSHSRGALLGVAAMFCWFWIKSKNKFITATLLLMLVPVAFSFMPEKWHERMESIDNYQEDSSAQGRIKAWIMAFNVANARPLTGGGFEIWNRQSFATYYGDASSSHAAHSIYFAVLGEHGWIGLFLFITLWILAYREASRIIRQTKTLSGWQWAADLLRMIQVSWVGYAVGGAFLSLAYFDVPYYLIVIVVLLGILVDRETKVRGGTDIPGISKRVPAQSGSTAPQNSRLVSEVNSVPGARLERKYK